MAKNDYIEIMEKNHMEIPWHDYTENDSEVLIQQHFTIIQRMTVKC